MWEANWINEINPSLDELSHHGIKGMHWGVRRERLEITPAQKETFKVRNTKIKRNLKFAHRALILVGTAYAARNITKYGHVPVKSIANLTVKGVVKISDSKTPAGLAGKLAMRAITADIWKQTFSALNTEISEADVSKQYSPERR